MQQADFWEFKRAETVRAVAMSGIGIVAPTGSASTPLVRSAKDQRRTRDCPRVTVRLSFEDRAKLTELADGMALSTYLRAKALSQPLPRRRRSGVSIQDREAIAQVLGLLGQSRIANNLNQLAHHANIGALDFDEETKTQINEAYAMVLAMRSDLLKALGFKT